jgi:sugar lactone lactonase YvrE
MASGDRILDRLPSLYRAEPGYDDDDLLLQLSMAVGDLLDRLGQDSSGVMQAHWFDYADSAIYSTWLGRRRTLNSDGPLTLDDPLIDQFPYLLDLPRIAAMVDLAPWKEPLRDRERVEAFRERTRRIVRLHRDGLGTVRALRTMTMAALPQVDPDAPAGLRERSFTVEEFSGARQLAQAISQVGLPAEQVGPLMRWQVDSASLDAVAPLVVIEGVTPEPGRVDPTSEPIIERFDPAAGTGVGIHYQGDLAPGQALALAPGYHSWLGRGSGIDRAAALPGGVERVNPTAPGPWVAEVAPPAGAVIDLQQTEDHSLWAAANLGGAGSLSRSDGTAWVEELGSLPEVRCLLPLGNEMLIGFQTGLSRIEIQPSGGFTLNPDPATLTDPAVNALAIDRDGTVWAATDRGLARLQSGVLVYTALGGRSETETPLRALWADPSGDIYCGGDLGLFIHRTVPERFYILRGEAVDEAIDDWVELDLATGTLPDPEAIFVPSIHAIAHGADTDIWLGTAQGIARYRAREQRRTYTTLLEAMPHLTESAVAQIQTDARGRLWFATGEGLFVYDQLDWFQRQGDELVRLPRQEEEPLKPRFWRYVRATSRWQSLAPPNSAGFQNDSGTPLGSSEPAITAIAWTETALARLGSFDGATFTVDDTAIPAALATRYKPDPTRIVDGGIAAVPRLPSGSSSWRYLQREEPAPPTPVATPAWTREGRLLPPPGAREAPYEGRYLAHHAQALGESVFAFNPAARVWLQWSPRAPLCVTVRLALTTPDEQVDPMILDRVWNELQRVKPAAVTVYLAVDETIERG